MGSPSESCGAALPLGLSLESSGSLRCLSRPSLCSLQLFSAALSAEKCIYFSICCLIESIICYENKQNIHLDHQMKSGRQVFAAEVRCVGAIMTVSKTPTRVKMKGSGFLMCFIHLLLLMRFEQLLKIRAAGFCFRTLMFHWWSRRIILNETETFRCLSC